MRRLRGPIPAYRFPMRGEIWYGTLDPVVGHKQGGRRPLLIVSDDRFNALPRQMAVVLPLTTSVRDRRFEVIVDPEESGLPRRSAILCDAPRTISTGRLDTGRGRVGSVQPATLAAVEDRLHWLLGL